MDTQKIKVILSAIEHRSLSKAAAEISYTPSAMSHIADSVEEELGVKILTRTPLGVSLSREGEALYDYMVALVEAEKALINASRALTKEQENHLRIGAFSSISQNILPEMIGQFRQTHPSVKISVSVEDDLYDWLERDLVDVVFSDAHSRTDTTWIPIMEDPFVAVVPSHAFKDKRRVSKEDLYGYTYISVNESILDSYFDKTRFASVLEYESIDNMSVLYMVRQGVGVSILPRLMMNQKISGVKALKLEEPISRTIGFAYKKGAKHTEVATAFIDFLKKRARS